MSSLNKMFYYFHKDCLRILWNQQAMITNIENVYYIVALARKQWKTKLFESKLKAI